MDGTSNCINESASNHPHPPSISLIESFRPLLSAALYMAHSKISRSAREWSLVSKIFESCHHSIRTGPLSCCEQASCRVSWDGSGSWHLGRMVEEDSRAVGDAGGEGRARTIGILRTDPMNGTHSDPANPSTCSDNLTSKVDSFHQ